jgi:TonB family protein
VSLALHVLVLGGAALLLRRAPAASDDARAPLRVDLAARVLDSPPPAPPASRPPAEREDFALRLPPEEVRPEPVPPLPPEPPAAQEEDLDAEPLPSPRPAAPLPTHEVPPSAVRPRPAPPRLPPAPPLPPPRVVPPRAPQARRRPPARRTARPLRVLRAPDVARWYPEEARRHGIQGTAVVRLTVDREGRVARAWVIRSSGSDLLDRQAVRMAYAYRFTAGDGGRADLPVRFVLD